MTVAAHLADQFPGQLCFKGGFVLRHVRGSGRFSADLDATRTNPPKHKIAAAEIAETMRRATDEPMLRIEPGVPATDSQHSLDFDQIAFHTPHHDGQIAVEISYREAVADEPEWTAIGLPYYAQFHIPVLTLAETVAEKLRTLLQRQRPTDLSDLALILGQHDDQLDRAHVRQLAREVRAGQAGRPAGANRSERGAAARGLSADGSWTGAGRAIICRGASVGARYPLNPVALKRPSMP